MSLKPVRLPAAATQTLPRLVLFTLCLLYIIPGLFGRDPWKIGEDAASFGVMWTMAHGGLNDWLWPHLAGLSMPQQGPLSYWIGALFIKLAGWLIGDDEAARLSGALFFVIGAASVWGATYVLGQRQEAQPLQLAFGGQPAPNDFGRTLADGALLIYIGSVGLLIHSHLATPATLQISLIACALYFTTRLFNTTNDQHATRIKLTIILGAVFGFLVLTRGWLVPLALWLTCLLLASFYNRKLLIHLTLIALPIAISMTAVWLIACHFVAPFNDSPYQAWVFWNRHEFFRPSFNSIDYFLKYSIWFTWPAWPFAAWAVYAWRRQTAALHIAIPLSFLITLIVLAICSPYAEQSSLMPLIPLLSILAAFGLPTMKRGAINAVDWFSVMAFSLLALFIWLHWIAMQTGWPAKLHHNVFKMMPGFVAQFHVGAFAIALIATLAWIKLVHWRISRHPGVLWRAVVLSSSGVVLCWLLAMTLWMPWINYRVSYQPLAVEIASHLPEEYNCVATNIGPAQRASFAYFGQIHFATFNTTTCDYFLAQRHPPKQISDTKNMETIWEGHRAADKSERFTLLKKNQKKKEKIF